MLVPGLSVNYTADLQTEYSPHRLGGFFLSCGGDLDVGVQGEAGGEVTQHTGHRLDVHTVLERNGCKMWRKC